MLRSRLLPGCCLALAILAAPIDAYAQVGGGGQAQAQATAGGPNAVAARARALPRAVPAPVAKTWIKLQQKLDLDFGPETPVADVLKHLQESTVDADFPEGLTIYLEPAGPLPPGQTPAPATVSLTLKKVPLTAALGFLASQLGVTFGVQQDGIVVLGHPAPWPSEPLTEPQARTWLRLARTVAVPFGEETPLKDVLNFLREQAREPEKGKDGPGTPLPIYLDPVGLEKAEEDADSTVAIQLEGVPLSTSLGLILDQLGLTYRVQQDGILVVTTPDRASAFDPPSRVGGMGGMGGMSGGMGGGMGGMGGGFR